jgi:uncharacterized protein YndB with AHSA1/START domain
MRRPEEARLDTLPTTAREVIEVERWIGARPEIVFSYFTDPERFLRWHGEDASIDPHPGGAFRVSFGGPSGGVVRGEFLEVVAPRKLVFTWGWEGVTFMDNGVAALLSRPSTVEISLKSKGEGTVLRLRQTGPMVDSSVPHATSRAIRGR